MLPERIIIHTKNIGDISLALMRLDNVLPKYFEYKPPQDGRRLTCRYERDGNSLIMYHDGTDAVVWSWD